MIFLPFFFSFFFYTFHQLILFLVARVSRYRRKGKGGIFAARTHKRNEPSKMRPIDYSERNGYLRGVIKSIYHDPGRGAPMAIVQFKDPYRFRHQNVHMVAAEGMYTGQYIYAGNTAELTVGNILPLGTVPEGAMVCNVEARTGDRGTLARASGTFVTVISHNKAKNRTRVVLPSGHKKVVPSDCRAVVGIVAGGGRTAKPLLKAGRAYWKYKMKTKVWPRTRGVAMNVVEHNHGGGSKQHIGKSSTVPRHVNKPGLIAARRSGRRRGKIQLSS